MPNQRQPIELIKQKGRKHLTKSEIEHREKSEVNPCADNIAPPSFLTAKQKAEFNKISGQLCKIKIMGETDCDTLARYIVAQTFYTQTVKDIRVYAKEKPDLHDPDCLAWTTIMESLDKRQDRYFKQAEMAAKDLGLTISSRCRLEVPVREEEPKQNKFKKFEELNEDEDDETD